ncbi:pollen-specific leucine-rich repeat extensin-like protein 1 [Arachis duranensis]|uniref:Pollen-specific leucine-rich repeat extensin-like protein 1 n=1 Tax=Arachis duranensis TaxID=130453 RepID=A0A6P4D9U7_ARADU|nr:pollen-specific leucine-rich repeat extensin-like protein 1 [Arachis duranensis]
MPCIHALAAIRKRRDQPQDYVHPWLCMESIRRTYAHCIQPVPSSEFWARTEFTQPDPPIIKRGIGRPKVHNQQKDPAEPMMQGGKLKKSFSVSCSKCGEKGHNYKTCKGAPSNPNWKPKTKKPKKKKESTSQALVCLPLSQSAPPPEDPSHSQPPSSTPQQQQPTVPSGAGPSATNVAPAPTRVTRSTIVLGPPAPMGSSARPSTPNLNQPFMPPGNAPRMVTSTGRPKQPKFRPKQKIFRPPAPLASAAPPTSTQHQETVHQAPSSTQATAQHQQAPPPQVDKPTVSASKESNE